MLHPPLLIHHAARRGHNHPPGSLAALRACLDAGAQSVEIDILPLADGNFLLFHDPVLDEGTTGKGLVVRYTTEQLRGLRYTRNGWPTAEHVSFLDEALELAAGYATLRELQLDLKPVARLAPWHFAFLQRHLAPLGKRVRISTVADWELVPLADHLPDLPLGFDPSAYFDDSPPGAAEVTPGGSPAGSHSGSPAGSHSGSPAGSHSGSPAGSPDGVRRQPPRFRGAYGYWDDHPLAGARWGETRDYLTLRAQQLNLLVPPDLVWFMHGTTLDRALADGFNWIAYLQDRGHEVAAWTIDPARPDDLALAQRLVAAGIDRITTDDAPALARALEGRAEY